MLQTEGEKASNAKHGDTAKKNDATGKMASQVRVPE